MRARYLDTSSRSFGMPIACAWMALFCAIHFPALAGDNASQIRVLIGATWDKPDSKVEADPVVISGRYAVASWAQGSHGGRALLRLGDKGWSVVLCSGDAIKSAKGLVEAGVPLSDADRIAGDLEKAEALLPAEKRGKFSLFEGTALMEKDAPLPSSHHQH